MKTLCPSPAWTILLQAYNSFFTKPGYLYFCAFLVVLAHQDGRICVTQVVLSRLLERHYTCFHQFLSRAIWSVEAVSKRLYAQCLPRCLREDGRLLVAIDDTVCQKYEPKFEGLGVHHDPMNKQNPKRLSRGHCLVCLALLAQPIPERFVALFVRCALYLQEKACAAGKTFQTKLELAVGLLLEWLLPPDVLVVAVVDGAYARKAFVRPVCASGRHGLSRLRSDTVFYDLPPQRRKGKDGKYPPGAPKNSRLD